MSIIYINPFQFATPAGPTDPYFSNVSLLLHGDGTNGSTTIVDSSPSPKTVTAFGDAQISTAQSKFGGASIALDGTGDYLSLSDTSVFDVGTGDFTIEWWQKLAATNVNYTQFKFNNNGGIKAANATIQLYSQSPSMNVAASATFTTNWEHIAVCRQAGVVFMFQNGSSLPTNIVNSNPGQSISPTLIEIGTPYASYVSHNGYIDDLRITKGARYISNFTPPTAPFPDA